MRRGTFLVDPAVQGRFGWKVVSYWFFCLLAVELFVACWLVWLYRPSSSLELIRLVMQVCAVPFAASLLLLPIVVFDSLRFSHRITGPMVRLRRAVKEMAAGQPASLVLLRDGDFWGDFATDLNQLIERVDKLESELRDRKAKEEEPCGV